LIAGGGNYQIFDWEPQSVLLAYSEETIEGERKRDTQRPVNQNFDDVIIQRRLIDFSSRKVFILFLEPPFKL